MKTFLTIILLPIIAGEAVAFPFLNDLSVRGQSETCDNGKNIAVVVLYEYFSLLKASPFCSSYLRYTSSTTTGKHSQTTSEFE